MAILYPILPPPINPQIAVATVASVAPGASTALDFLQVSIGKEAKLMSLIVTSSVAFKAELRVVNDGVEGNDQAIWYSPVGGWHFTPPAPTFITVFGSNNFGTNGFRVFVTNLGIDPADISAVFYYDEE